MSIEGGAPRGVGGSRGSAAVMSRPSISVGRPSGGAERSFATFKGDRSPVSKSPKIATYGSHASMETKSSNSKARPKISFGETKRAPQLNLGKFSEPRAKTGVSFPTSGQTERGAVSARISTGLGRAPTRKTIEHGIYASTNSSREKFSRNDTRPQLQFGTEKKVPQLKVEGFDRQARTGVAYSVGRMQSPWVVKPETVSQWGRQIRTPNNLPEITPVRRLTQPNVEATQFVRPRSEVVTSPQTVTHALSVGERMPMPTIATRIADVRKRIRELEETQRVEVRAVPNVAKTETQTQAQPARAETPWQPNAQPQRVETSAVALARSAGELPMDVRKPLIEEVGRLKQTEKQTKAQKDAQLQIMKKLVKKESTFGKAAQKTKEWAAEKKDTVAFLLATAKERRKKAKSSAEDKYVVDGSANKVREQEVLVGFENALLDVEQTADQEAQMVDGAQVINATPKPTEAAKSGLARILGIQVDGSLKAVIDFLSKSGTVTRKAWKDLVRLAIVKFPAVLKGDGSEKVGKDDVERVIGRHLPENQEAVAA